MMGKTNTVYAETSKANELSLVSEAIITDSSDDIWKIEHVNNMFFAFLDDGNVMYGEDITELKFLKKDGENFHASYVIHKDGKYIFMCTESSSDRMYMSTDLNRFETVEMAEKVKYEYGIGLFLNSRGEIVVLTAASDSSRVSLWHIGSFQSIDEMTDESHFVDADCGDSDRVVLNRRSTRILNNRYMVYKDTVCYIVSAEGSVQKRSTNGSSDYIIGQEMYICNQTNSNDVYHIKIYHSLNGLQSTLIADLSNNDGDYVAYIAQCGEGIGIFSNKRLADIPDLFAFLERKENMLDSFPGVITSDISRGSILCDCVVGEYTYLGCKGGIIHKIFVDFSGSSNSPQVSVLKTLSAKQALAESKIYTDKKFAELEARITALNPNTQEIEELKIYISDDGNLYHTDGFVISKKGAVQNG